MFKKFLDLPIGKKIYLPVLVSIFFSVVLVSVVSYFSVKMIEKKVISSIRKDLKNFFYLKLEEKKSVSKVGAIIISQNSIIKKALFKKNRKLAIREIKNIPYELREYTKFKNVKIHIHTSDIKSFLRSWKLDKYGDDLSLFRKSLLFEAKKRIPIACVEIGKVGLVIRGIAPIFYNKKYVGSVELIQGLNSIALDLKRFGIYTLIVFDKRYLKIAKFIKKPIFVMDNFVVALKNYAYSKEFFEEIKNAKFKKFLETKNFFVVTEPIKDFEGNVVAWAILGKKNSLIKEIIFNNIKTLIIQILLMIFIDILMLIAIFYVVSKFITKPVLNLEESLESFFEFLKDPKKKINLPVISSKDEIGQMSKMIRDNIKVASYLHSEMANLLSLVDKNIIIMEIDEDKKIKKVSEAFRKLNLKEEEVIEKIDWNSLYEKEFWDGEIKVGDKYLFVKVHKKCINDIDCGYTLIGYDITDKKRLHELTITLEERVKEKTKEVYIERELLKEAHKKINDSIKFASLIQKAIFPKEEEFRKFFEDYFILWKPRDIVGGDTYFFERIDENRALLMVIDCTGHGVPGAFITMIVKAIEKEIVSKKIYTPSEILTQFHDSLKRLLESNEVGFDGAVVYIDKKENILKFSASNSTLFYYDNGEVKSVRGSRVSVGYKRRGKYKDSVIELGKSFYITTDGFIDQIGGDKNIPFGKTRFIEIIKQNVNLPMKEQKIVFENVLRIYKGENHQIDDITVIGFKI